MARQSEQHLPIVRPSEFLQSTRESGYRSTPLALAELVDNSIEAGAKRIEVRVIPSVQEAEASADGKAKVHELVVIDDGAGMDADTLAKALAFGGSSRFGSRTGMGRFGMGLPNASLSQCRHVEVYSWQDGGKPKLVSLDLDSVVETAAELLAPPATKPLPLPYVTSPHPDQGTVVAWKKCDRLDRQGMVVRLAPYLRSEFGRIYRHALTRGGLNLIVAGEPVQPIDPLYLSPVVADDPVATMLGAPVEVDIPIPSQPGQSAKATVTTSILPWEWQKEWRHTGQDEKERRFLAETSGISIVRAGREIRIIRNPYHARHWTDAWYRVEVRFGPELDEVFGVTHTKQDVRLDEHTAAYDYLEPVIVPRVQQMRNLIVERRAKASTRPAPTPEPKPERKPTPAKGPTPGGRLHEAEATQPMILDQTVLASSIGKLFKDTAKKLTEAGKGHMLRVTIMDLGRKPRPPRESGKKRKAAEPVTV